MLSSPCFFFSFMQNRFSLFGIGSGRTRVIFSLPFVLLLLILSAATNDPAFEYTYKARKLYEAGKIREAIAEYKRALRYNPEYISARLHLGYAYMSMKNYAGAVEQFRRVLKANPTHAYTHYNLSCVYALSRKKRAAIRELHRAFLLDERLVDTAKADADLGFLRDDPDFQSLLNLFLLEKKTPKKNKH